MTTSPDNRESFFDMRVGERTRELLEDFDVVGTLQYLVLLPRGQYFRHLRENLRAAVVASTLHLQSLDYAKRRYCEAKDDDEHLNPTVVAYIGAYSASKAYVTRLLGKVKTEGCPDPTLGVFGASLALERLPPSFFCAHFLYRMGHSYEGHAVSRLILEQVAWAYAAHALDDLEAIKKIDTTRALSRLKRFAPVAGEMYGFLSKKTHIDYSSHREFLQVEDGRNVVLHAQSRYAEYGDRKSVV